MSVIIQNIFHPLTVTVKVLYTHIRTLGLIQTLYLQLLYEVPGTKLFRVTITDSKFNYTGLWQWFVSFRNTFLLQDCVYWLTIKTKRFERSCFNCDSTTDKVRQKQTLSDNTSIFHASISIQHIHYRLNNSLKGFNINSGKEHVFHIWNIFSFLFKTISTLDHSFSRSFRIGLSFLENSELEFAVQ